MALEKRKYVIVRTESHGTDMAGRLGNVLYWLFCAVAVLFVVLGVFGTAVNGIDNVSIWPILGVAVAAVLAWLIGRACRYILAGT